MKKLSLVLTSFALLYSANATVVRFGPSIGFGMGTVLGLKERGDKVNFGFGLSAGGIAQFEFEKFGIDTGLYYQTRFYAFKDKADTDNDGTKDTQVLTLTTGSFEIPLTAYYQLRLSKGYFKFGGGLAADIGVGDVSYDYENTQSTAANEHPKEDRSYSAVGLKRFELLGVLHTGYQFNFNAWSLSLDLKPKIGITDRLSGNTLAKGSWHTFMVDFSAGFLF